nr:hypothetical protein [uncultured Cohaesibacter sp.]
MAAQQAPKALSLTKRVIEMMMLEPNQEHIMQFFTYSHLPEHLQKVSKPFATVANEMISTLPRNPERTVALRKLLEAKDAAVRAVIAE